jgi:hypothetical protein
VRSAAIPLLILAGLALGQQEVRAGTVYSIVDYPADQNGYNIEGSITTDGSTGTMTTTDFITGWNITILKNGVTQVTYSGGSGAAGGAKLSAGDLLDTSKSISLDFSTATDLMLQASGANTEWQSLPGPTNFTVYASSDTQQLFWASAFPQFSLIATAVPEPPAAVLAGIGAGIVIACGLVRKRRAQRRQAA